MKNYILFAYLFLIVNLSGNTEPFAAFLVDERTKQEITARIRPIAEPLVERALAKLPHRKAQALRLAHATLGPNPKILDFSLGETGDSSASLTDWHVSLALKRTPPHSLRTTLVEAVSLIGRCPLRVTGARRMGRYIALPLAIDTSHLSGTKEGALVNDLTQDAHISVMKINDVQKEFIYLKPREIGEQKAEDMLTNLSAIFKSYTNDMRTLSAKSPHSSAQEMEVDPVSPPRAAEKSPLGKGGRSHRSPLTSPKEASTISPRNNTGGIHKKKDLSPATRLSEIALLSPSRTTQLTSPKKPLTPKQLFSAPSQAGAAAAASDASPHAASTLSQPFFSAPSQAGAAAAASDSPPHAASALNEQRRRQMFEDEIETYSKALAYELAKQNEDNLRRLTKFPPIIGINSALIKRNMAISPTKDRDFIDFLSYGIKVQLLGLFKGDIEAPCVGKENIYRGKQSLYRGKESLTTAQHDQILALEDNHPLSAEQEGSRLERVKFYLTELYKVPYKEDMFNENLSSLIPSGRIWQPQIEALDHEIKMAPFPVTLGALVTERIP